MSGMRRYQPGQRVRVICPGSFYNGCETVVVDVVINAYVREPDGRKTGPHPILYRTDLQPMHGYKCVSYEPHELIPIDDDRFESGSWSEIEKLTKWKPAGVSA